LRFHSIVARWIELLHQQLRDALEFALLLRRQMIDFAFHFCPDSGGRRLVWQAIPASIWLYSRAILFGMN